MLNVDGTRCITCGSISPEWKTADDFDGPEDFGDAQATWESIHEDCMEGAPDQRRTPTTRDYYGDDAESDDEPWSVWREETYDPDDSYLESQYDEANGDF